MRDHLDRHPKAEGGIGIEADRTSGATILPGDEPARPGNVAPDEPTRIDRIGRVRRDPGENDLGGLGLGVELVGAHDQGKPSDTRRRHGRVQGNKSRGRGPRVRGYARSGRVLDECHGGPTRVLYDEDAEPSCYGARLT